jgi:PEP-CTERM motif
MKTKLLLKSLGLLLAGAGVLGTAQARTEPVAFNLLTASGTVSTPFAVGDVLRLNTLVTTEVGALLQNITFTVASGVTQLTGEAAWEISSATGTAPRLIGVNIDIFDSSNALVLSDSFAGTLGGFAVSTFAGAIGPGTYTMRATGTGVRASSLDVSLAFAVPEPGTYALMVAGLLGLAVVRRRQTRPGAAGSSTSLPRT